MAHHGGADERSASHARRLGRQRRRGGTPCLVNEDALKKSSLHALSPLIGLVLFAVALWVLHRSLSHQSLRDVMREFSNIPLHRLIAAFFLTVASYLLLTGYDWLAFHYLGHPMPYPRVALVGFIGYSLSNNFGNALITGGSVRYRIYSSWGLSALDITRVVLFCSITFFIGMLTLGGAFFIIDEIPVPPMLHFLPFSSLRPVGAFFLLLVAGYMTLAIRGRPLTILGMAFEIPSPRLALAQIGISSVDLFSSAAVFYSLLPYLKGYTFFAFLGYYLVAVIAGLVSQVPGGLGIFESIMMVGLAEHYPPATIGGVLVAYRAIYYLLPLGIGMILLFGQELREHAHRLEPVARILGRTFNVIAPNVLAALTFLGGTMLLFSGAIPLLPHRLKFLSAFMPLYLMEASHLLGSLAGIVLLLLARGLQRRSDAAWHVSALLVASGVVFSLAKGLDYEEAAVLALLLALLLACRGFFYRKASFFSGRFTPGWVAAIVIVLLSTVWLGLFTYRKVEFTQDLWWQFTLHADAPRYLRATLGTLVVACSFAIARLLRPAAPEPQPPTVEELEEIEAIVRVSPRTNAWLALLGDKSILYDDARSAFIMYGIQGRSWIAMGDPVGPDDLAADLIWDFRELCDRHGGWSVFYQVTAANLPLYLDLGLTPLKLGEEARISLTDFSLEGGRRKGLRSTVNRLGKDGCSFEIVPAEAVAPLLPELRAISDGWLAEKHAREKRFSLGRFQKEYLTRFPLALVRQDGRLIAYSNIWPGAGRQELSADMMRHVADAPASVMEYLFAQIMLWGREQGYKAFNMGMAPLSGLENRALAPLWSRIGSTIFHHGEHFYNFQGLRAFKEKYDPDWQPLYLVSPAGLALPNILLNVASIIAGGAQGIVRR
jgi:phosphatidylglycerol lysyltransferase